MLTYENIKKTLNEQEDEILVKIHNKYCEEKETNNCLCCQRTI